MNIFLNMVNCSFNSAISHMNIECREQIVFIIINDQPSVLIASYFFPQ